MADKNVPSAETNDSKLKAVESKQKKAKKEPMTFKKLITIIIIVVLALLMVGGVYYVVVMIAQSKAEKSSAWGSYDGESINLENNSVFYNTLVNDSNLQTAYLNGDYNTLLSSYYNAYQSQVVFTALLKEAKQAGIVAPQELVNDLIIRAGVYNDDSGNFSDEIFNSSSEAERITVNTYYTNYYPYNVVVSDLQSSIVSVPEVDFVKEVAAKTRTFDYFVIDFNAYPDELAVAYGQENPTLFDKAEISVLSASTEENIKAAYEALNAGTAWADVVATYSQDSYASSEGKVGSLNIFSIVTNMSDPASIDQLTALEVGAYTAPIQSPSGYSIYKLDSAIVAADFSDAETLAAVKYYIDANDIDDVTPYVDTAVGLAAATAQNDFEAAAEGANATIISVSASNNNVAGSQYLGGLDYYDTTGYLAASAKDEAVSRELFTSEEGYVTGAMAVADAENTYIIAKVTGINDDDTNATYVATMLYNYYATMQPVYDRFYNVINSDKHTDNFYTQFFATVLSSSN